MKKHYTLIAAGAVTLLAQFSAIGIAISHFIYFRNCLPANSADTNSLALTCSPDALMRYEDELIMLSAIFGIFAIHQAYLKRKLTAGKVVAISIIATLTIYVALKFSL